MYALGSYLTEKEAKRVLKVLAEEIGEENVCTPREGYLMNLLDFSAMRGYPPHKCLEIINS